MRALPLVLALGVLAACDDMAQQPRYDPYERAALFPDGSVAQPPVPGTVPFDPAEPGTAPPPVTAALLERGQRGYAAFCAPCHGPAGDGDGMAAGRYVPHPPGFDDPRLRALPADAIVRVIETGVGRMASHAHQVEPGARWAVAWYVKALQRFAAEPPARPAEPVDAPAPPGGGMTPLLRERLDREAAARTRIPSAEALAELAAGLSAKTPSGPP
ncbi:c-type cytochrome [Azospirillum sp. ST 5-10]|uniref:c-type cytochrome n=1 Tax=unclassified Azospirillum TaxID=2630922 RepID=UPI003F49B9AD